MKRPVFNSFVGGCAVRDGVLTWKSEEDAAAYGIVDIDMNVMATVPAAHAFEFDLTGKTLAYGVYPIFAEGFIPFGRILHDKNCEKIKYLDGDGTAENPYLIRTPFDLRAIDYYETVAAVRGSRIRNHYRLAADLDFRTVAALQGESNIRPLKKPFFGVLDGAGRTIKNINVRYCCGYWALFDHIAPSGEVKNIVFDGVKIHNKLQRPAHPLNASIAAVAYRNYGSISGIVLNRAEFTAAGGKVCGICTHNSGTVTDCTVSGEFVQVPTGTVGQACYEMAGVVAVNYGAVVNNTVTSLSVRGSRCIGVDGNSYNNVRVAGGIVAVNRETGVVRGNRYRAVDMVGMLDNYGVGGGEFGGLVAYNAGVVAHSAELGTFMWNASGGSVEISRSVGTAEDLRGKLIGKNDGGKNVA